MTDCETREFIKRYRATHHEELEKRKAETRRRARFMWNLNVLIKKEATNEELLFYIDANSDPSIRVGGYSMKERRRWLDRLTEKYKLD